MTKGPQQPSDDPRSCRAIEFAFGIEGRVAQLRAFASFAIRINHELLEALRGLLLAVRKS